MLSFCCSRYDVANILSVTRHIASRYVDSHIVTRTFLHSLELRCCFDTYQRRMQKLEAGDDRL